MKTKIYFRVDALKGFGQGHLVRCLALAEMLKTNFDCVFLAKIDVAAIAKSIDQKGFSRIEVPSNYLNIDEAEWIKNNYLTGEEILVLDAYYFRTDYQEVVRSGAGKLVCIDDIHDTHFLADAIINHGGGIQPEDYHCEKRTKLYLGLDYLILRKAFFESSQRLNTNPQINTILICLGGEDPKNDTLSVLAQCENVAGIKSCKVVLGSAFRHEDALDTFRQESSLNIEIFRNLSAVSMASLMQACDTAICPPSTVALEYLSIGGNLFLHQTANNQQYLQAFLLNEGLAFSAKEIGQIPLADLFSARNKQRNAIDGESPSRLLRVFQKLELELNTQFRLATMKDVQLYFDWANDKNTRQQSFSSEPIPFQEHSEWFVGKMNNGKCRLYVMEYKGVSVGQIRFDIEDNKAKISYSLDANYRGKGLGRFLLKGGMKKVKEDLPAVEQIIGYVKSDNHASVYVFQKLNFVKNENAKSNFEFSQAV